MKKKIAEICEERTDEILCEERTAEIVYEEKNC
jgi:hypothetical protein